MIKDRYNKYDVAIGKIIKDARKAKKLEVYQVVEKVGMKAVSTYFDYERGKIGLSMPRFFAICDVLGIDPMQAIEQARQEIKNG